MTIAQLFAAAVAFSADTAATREYLDRYREILALAPLADRVADVSQLVLKRDAAEIVLQSGQLYLLTPVGGRTVGAVFRGTGRFLLKPRHPAEQAALRKFTDAAALDHSFTEVILLFADSTWNQLTGLSFGASAVPGELRGSVRDVIGDLRGEKDGTFTSSVLAPFLNGDQSGFFLAHIRRSDGGPVLLQIDPRIVESVQLFKPASQRRWGANWAVVTQFAPEVPLPGSTAMWHYRNRVATPHYRMEVWLTPTGTGDLKYAAAAQVRLHAAEAVGPWLYFGLHPKLLVDSARWSDGQPAPVFKVEDDDDLWVRAPRRLAPGDSLVLHIFYQGDLIDRFGDWFFIDPGADWYPTNRQGQESATFDVTYHSPSWYPIASIGERTDSSADGRVMTTRWVMNRPTPFARFNLGLFEPYHVQHEGAPPLDVLIAERAHRLLRRAGIMEQRNKRENVAADISNSLKWFTFAFGKPAFDHFYVTEIPYFEGVSFPGLIDLSWVTFQNTSLDGFDEFFRAHEVAHQWWGNGVRPASYRDAWLSEGVASFSGLWYLQAIRKTNKEYFRFLDEYFTNIRDNQDEGATWLGYRGASPNAPYAYQALVYEKGAWIIHMLRILMLDLTTKKDDRFSAMMREFHSAFNGKSASTDDFRRVVEGHIGVPMNWFFDQWVKGTAIPTYRVAWKPETTPDGRARVRLRVTQENVPADFQMWVLVAADLGENRFANFRIRVTGQQREYTSPVLPAAPRAITFNELRSVLADVRMERW